MQDEEYIYAVYETKSFSAAAKKLYVSQPALSMSIKKTEEKMGITIFDRSTVPLKLTEEGKLYIQALEEIRLVKESLNRQLSDIGELKAGHLIVSGENFVSSFILPEVIMRFSQLYGGIDVEIVESNSPGLRQQLLSESIDLLVAHDFDQNLYHSEYLFEEELLLAVPEGFSINQKLSEYCFTADELRAESHPEKPAVDLSLFQEEPFLILKPGNDSCRRGNQMCSEAGFKPKVRIHLDQLITAHNLSCAGMGISFVSDILVKKAAASGCVYYRLDSEYAHRTMSIGYKKNRYLSRAAAAFIDTAKAVYLQK